MSKTALLMTNKSLVTVNIRDYKAIDECLIRLIVEDDGDIIAPKSSVMILDDLNEEKADRLVYLLANYENIYNYETGQNKPNIKVKTK